MSEQNYLNIPHLVRLDMDQYEPNHPTFDDIVKIKLQVYILESTNYGLMVNQDLTKKLWFSYRINHNKKIVPNGNPTFEQILDLGGELVEGLLFNLDIFAPGKKNEDSKT